MSPQPGDGNDVTPNDSENDEMDDGSGSEGELENIWSCDEYGDYLQENYKDKHPEM